MLCNGLEIGACSGLVSAHCGATDASTGKVVLSGFEGKHTSTDIIFALVLALVYRFTLQRGAKLRVSSMYRSVRVLLCACIVVCVYLSALPGGTCCEPLRA